MEVICIDDTHRPEDIPLSYWVKRDNKYTVSAVYKDMNGVMMFEIDEIDLKSLGLLYKGFAASRFREPNSLDEMIEELNSELKKESYAY